jgi:hypothetical protein
VIAPASALPRQRLTGGSELLKGHTIIEAGKLDMVGIFALIHQLNTNRTGGDLFRRIEGTFMCHNGNFRNGCGGLGAAVATQAAKSSVRTTRLSKNFVHGVHIRISLNHTRIIDLGCSPLCFGSAFSKSQFGGRQQQQVLPVGTQKA